MGCKVQLFWEGHKNLRNPPHGFDIYSVNILCKHQNYEEDCENFLAFSEKLNFTWNSTFLKFCSALKKLLCLHIFSDIRRAGLKPSEIGDKIYGCFT